MAQLLIKTTENYRVDTEQEAMDMLESAKNAQLTDGYTLQKSGYSIKQKKSKGEVIDEYFIVSLTKNFD